MEFFAGHRTLTGHDRSGDVDAVAGMEVEGGIGPESIGGNIEGVVAAFC